MCLSQTLKQDQINEWRKVHGLKFETPTDGTMKPQQVVEALYKRPMVMPLSLQMLANTKCLVRCITNTNVHVNGLTLAV